MAPRSAPRWIPSAVLVGAAIAACTPSTPTTPTRVRASHAPVEQATPAPNATPTATGTATPPPPAASPTPTPVPTGTATPKASALVDLVQSKLLNLAKVGFNQNRSQLASKGDAEHASLLSDHGAGIISNNAGTILSDQGLGLITNNGGNIVSDHGSGFRLLAASPLPTLPPTATIAVTAQAGETLSDRRIFPDGTVVLRFLHATAADPAAYRVVHVRADKAFHEEAQEVLERWPNNHTKLKTSSQTDLYGDGALVGRFVLKHAFDLAGDPTTISVQPGSFLRDAASGAGDLVESLELDAVAHTGTFRYIYPGLGMVETGTETGVEPNAAGQVFLPYWDPLAYYDGEATARVGDQIVYTRTLKTTAGKRTTTFDLQDGLGMTLTPVDAPTHQEGRLSQDGKEVAGVKLEVAPEGTAVFTVTFDADPAKPLVIGYGAKGVPTAPFSTPSPEAVVGTVLGRTDKGFADGPAASARFASITGLAPSRKLPTKVYFTDLDNHRVRAFDLATQTVTTVAGDGQAAFKDGPGASAQFNSPRGIVAMADDTLYISERSNRIRMIAPDGTVSTLAGSGESGSADGMGTAATFNSLAGMALDEANGALYVADYYNAAIRRVGLTGADRGVVTTIANGASGLTNPLWVALGPDGALYVADTAGERIRKILLSDPAHPVTTLVGTSAPERQGMDGAALETGIGGPRALAFDPSGLLTWGGTNDIRQLRADGQVRTLVGTGKDADEDGLARSAALDALNALVYGPDGSLLIADGHSLRVLRKP